MIKRKVRKQRHHGIRDDVPLTAKPGNRAQRRKLARVERRKGVHTSE